MGYVNGLTQDELLGAFVSRGFRLDDWGDYSSAQGWYQGVFRLNRQSGSNR